MTLATAATRAAEVQSPGRPRTLRAVPPEEQLQRYWTWGEPCLRERYGLDTRTLEVLLQRPNDHDRQLAYRTPQGITLIPHFTTTSYGVFPGVTLDAYSIDPANGNMCLRRVKDAVHLETLLQTHRPAPLNRSEPLPVPPGEGAAPADVCPELREDHYLRRVVEEQRRLLPNLIRMALRQILGDEFQTPDEMHSWQTPMPGVLGGLCMTDGLSFLVSRATFCDFADLLQVHFLSRRPHHQHGHPTLAVRTLADLPDLGLQLSRLERDCPGTRPPVLAELTYSHRQPLS